MERLFCPLNIARGWVHLPPVLFWRGGGSMYAVIAAADDVAAASARATASARFYLQNFQMFLGCQPSFFCIQNLWSWILAKLQHNMLSVILHLLQKFKFSFFLGPCCRLLRQLLLHLLRPLQ